ncbi:phytoene/squalene synthase family protein [Dactylosporangium fulvum]|uniref:Phytoene/squalene synthase family protein n=1 Tax=Dactylosporangium fulvum TaxID=53359 RepID=A0ABY5VXS3_9ACTN|nr:phytoene/squalene synthase family protein [Dactylosporangium fulvum]UWP82598.1 phytoene/squalene synthase family protein [Dactylosporangium fulvum]
MDPAPLAAAYGRCKALHRQHGRTYYLATKLLPGWKRRHVHALYGFTRYADEIVDRTEALSPHQRAAELADWSAAFVAGLRGRPTDDPLLPAVLHTIQVFDIDLEDFRKFLDSMAMDLTVTEYATYDDLLEYMEGSAAVIGTMMLPILESHDRAAAREPARQLGLAFQLTNFIRDVAEDFERGRVYLPREDLDRFGVTHEDLRRAVASRTASDKLKALVRHELARARRHYAAAAPGIPMLAPTSQSCMRAAFRLYSGILDEVEAADCDVFARRATVSRLRRLTVALSCVLTRPGAPVPAPLEVDVPQQREAAPFPDLRESGLPA